MKKVLLLCLAIATLGISNSFASNNYYVDDAAVEEVFAQSVETFTQINLTTDLRLNNAEFADDKDPLVAILLNWLVGYLGIHRVYLDGRPTLILIYFITCGGIFYIVPLVDLITLIINYEDISAYIGNDKFIMW